MSSKTVCITGVTGFIGSHLAQGLRGRYRLVGLGTAATAPCSGLDLYRRMRLPHPGLTDFLRQTRPEIIVHCAGSASVPFSVTHPEADFLAGPALTFHLLEAVRQAGLKPMLIFPSSAAVYGNPARLPVAETSPLQPISPYGQHKLVSERSIQEFNQLHGLDYVILRIFSCFGQGLKKQLLWDAARKIEAGELILHGTGQETRDFIHVFDLVRLVSLLIEDDVKNMTLNVASGRQTTIKSVVEMLVAALGARIKPIFNGVVRAGDPLHWEADISRISSLGFSTAVGMDEGIGLFGQWYQEICQSPVTLAACHDLGTRRKVAD